MPPREPQIEKELPLTSEEISGIIEACNENVFAITSRLNLDANSISEPDVMCVFLNVEYLEKHILNDNQILESGQNISHILTSVEDGKIFIRNYKHLLSQRDQENLINI